MSKLLKERWNRLAFGKNNRSLNESDQWHGILPEELWQISDYTDARDEGILERLGDYSNEHLQMKIEQLEEEIQYELNNMDDPQNQYDQSVALKEALINYIKEILSRTLGESTQRVIQESASHPEKGECPDIYDWDKLVGIAQSMLMGRYSGRGEPPTGFMKAWNRYKSKGMNIPGILYDDTPECARLVMQIGSQQYRIQDGDYENICAAWLEDAERMEQFDWDYEG